MTVNPAQISVIALGGSSTYGDSPANPGLSASGLKNGQDVSVPTGLSNSFGIGSTTGAGTYATSVTGTLTNGNYVVTGTSGGQWIVDKAALTVTANDQTKTYGDTLSFDGSEFTTGAGQLKNHETIGTVTLSSAGAAATANVNGGTPYTISASGAAGGTFNANNYAITYVDGGLTVNRRAITVTADNQSRAYSDGNPTLSYTVGGSGLVNGDSLSGALSTGAGLTSDVGTYAVGQGSLTDANNGNYAIGYIGGMLTVNPAEITVAALGGSSTYGDSPTNPGLSASGLKNGQDVDVLTGLSNSFGIGKTTGAGTYTTSVTGTLTNGNYVVTGTSGGQWVVDKAALTVTADDASKSYDGEAYSGGNGISYSGFVNDEDSSVLGGALTYGGTAQGAVDAGRYTLLASGLTSANYDISYVGGVLTVTAQQTGTPTGTGPSVPNEGDGSTPTHGVIPPFSIASLFTENFSPNGDGTGNSSSTPAGSWGNVIDGNPQAVLIEDPRFAGTQVCVDGGVCVVSSARP